LSRDLPSAPICDDLGSFIATSSPLSIFSRIALLFKRIRVIDVMTARARKERKAIMTTFTIDGNNNITAFGSKEEAAGSGTSALIFTSQKELAKLAADWPAGRLIEIWNSFAGVAPFGDLKPVKKFTDRKIAVARIWQAIQRLDAESPHTSLTEQAAKPEPESATPEAMAEVPQPVSETAQEDSGVARGAAHVAQQEATATIDTSPAAKASKRKKTAKPEQQPAAPRESKTAQVVAMLQRPEGATISEIMEKMGWLKHTVRGFMAGAMKKAGYTVESFKLEGGERTYRINPK
jgi:hypothetical protein